MAIAGRGVEEEVLEMMPKGMLAMEKCESAGMESQEVIVAEVSMIMSLVGFVRIDIEYTRGRMVKDMREEEI